MLTRANGYLRTHIKQTEKKLCQSRYAFRLVLFLNYLSYFV